MNKKLVLFVFIIILFSFFVEAQLIKVGYVARGRANSNFLEIFEEKEYGVTVIDDSNIRSTDFSEFDILFVDDNDNKLKNAEFIPIGDMPTIVANSFHADEWGLTTEISLIAANEPLEVLIVGDGVKKVYTTCCVGGSGEGLPLYYLTDVFKANDFQSIAITNIGEEKGGVVQIMDTGGKLLNNKQIKGRMCFYGITETRYWTNAARDLF
ncbi:MAG: hypothetical protein AABW46_03395, partial [Nanoarchaeota archaeon]